MRLYIFFENSITAISFSQKILFMYSESMFTVSKIILENNGLSVFDVCRFITLENA